jgi:hypothetical protein
MYAEPLVDPFPMLLAELRGDADVLAFAGTDAFGRVRVRADEPAPAGQNGSGSITYPGDVRDAKNYQRFIVITTLDEPPHPRVPIMRGLYTVSVYAATFAQAREGWAAVVKAIHGRGARTSGDVAIYESMIDTGGEKDKDPDTDQPLIRGTIRATSSGMSV